MSFMEMNNRGDVDARVPLFGQGGNDVGKPLQDLTRSANINYSEAKQDYGSRLLDREAPFHQSFGRFNILRKNIRHSLYFLDPFHTILHWSTWKSLLLVALVWLFGIFSFAGVYYALGEDCGLKMHSYLDAAYFSLMTFTTIGYGTPDLYFNECTEALWVVSLQSFLSCLFDSLCLCLVYTRLSRSATRTSTIVFSNKAVIREIDGRLYFALQVAEMRKHQLVEAHVRCYAVKHDVDDSDSADPPVFFQACYMRLTHPDDEVNADLFLALPANVVHTIDTSSPLCPPGLRSRRTGFPRMSRRVDDFEDADNELTSDLKRANGLDFRGKVRQFMDRSEVEIIVLVEGIDFLTSDTLQARHSYLASEIEWDATFEPCVHRDTKTGRACVDFEKFHGIIDAPPVRNDLPADMPSPSPARGSNPLRRRARVQSQL